MNLFKEIIWGFLAALFLFGLISVVYEGVLTFGVGVIKVFESKESKATNYKHCRGRVDVLTDKKGGIMDG